MLLFLSLYFNLYSILIYIYTSLIIIHRLELDLILLESIRSYLDYLKYLRHL